MRKTCLLLLAVALLLPAAAAVAQDMEPTKYEGTWYQVITVDFKPGMRDRALQHIAENFAPAGMASGTGPDMILIHHSGDHDMTLVWKMKGGPADLEWDRSPDDVRWAKAMAEQHGGMEGMQEAWQEYMGMIHDVDVVIARSWNPMAGGGEDDGDDGEGDDGGDGDDG